MIYIYMTIVSVFFMYVYSALDKISISNTNNQLLENPLIELFKRFLFFLSFIVVCFPGMIRYDVGIDYTTYSLYQIPATLVGQANVKVETLYKIVIYFGNWLGRGTTYQWIFAITNLLIVSFVFKYIKDQSVNPTLSVFVFMFGGFFAFSLSGMRQSIGVAIALYSIKFIKQKKIFLFAISLGIAVLFHSSVAIFVFFYVFKNKKINPFIIVFLMAIIYAFSNTIRNIIIVISERVGIYSNYFGGTFDNGEFSRTLVFLIIAVMTFVCIAYLFLDKDKFYQSNTELQVHYMACFVIAMISELPTPSRLLYLFIPIYIILIPNLIDMFKNSKVRLFIGFIFVVILSLFMYRYVYMNNVYQILPYQDIFNLFS